MDAVVFGNNVARSIHHLSVEIQSGQALPDEIALALSLQEAQFLALRLFRNGEVEFTRNLAHFGLRQITQGKHRARKLLLCEIEEEIRLIFLCIARFADLIAAVRIFQTYVMACRDMRRTKLVRYMNQLMKLQPAVAVYTRTGCPSGDVIIHERLNHLLKELLLKIDRVKRNAKMMSDTPGIFHVLRSAAASCLTRPAGAVIPQLHGHADNVVSLLHEQGCGNRAIDASAHSNQNSFHKSKN